MERNRSQELFDIAAIGAALQSQPQSRGAEVVEFDLRDTNLGDVWARLAIIEATHAVSLYVRNGHGFLGFIHLEEIDRVTVDAVKGEVDFSGAAGPMSQLSVHRGGVFVVTRQRR